MAKKLANAKELNAAVAVANQLAGDKPAVTAPMYSIGKLPRNGLNEGTKHGEGGTAGTYKAVCAALADGPLSLEEIKAVCKEQGDAGFARYAVRNHWLLPVEPTK